MRMINMQSIATCLIIAWASAACLAQSSSGDTGSDASTTTSLADQTPLVNVKSGAVAERAPGLIVNAARAAFLERKSTRREAQTTGETSVLSATSGLTGLTTGSSNAISDLLGDVLGSGLLGSIGGQLGNLTGLLGNLGGSQTGTTTTSSGSSGSSTTNSNVPSNLTPEAIRMLEDAGFDVNELFAQSRDEGDAAKTASTASTLAGTSDNSIAGILKSDSRAQTADTTETKFVMRWADAMLSTLFSGIVLAINSSPFVDALTDALRPIFFPTTDTSTDTSSDPNDGSTNSGDSVVWVVPVGAAAT